jgi:ribosomal protein S18 acetylase RimI-like enzyme
MTLSTAMHARIRPARRSDTSYTPGEALPEDSLADAALALRYYHAHLLLEPEACFVLVTDEGDVVGCMRTTPDALAFARRYEVEILADLDPGVFPRPGTAAFDARTNEEQDALAQLWNLPSDLRALQHIAVDYPALFHIGVDEAYRGRGHGTALMVAAEARWRELGVPGAFVQPSDDRATRYFVRLGWQRVDGATLVKRL